MKCDVQNDYDYDENFIDGGDLIEESDYLGKEDDDELVPLTLPFWKDNSGDELEKLTVIHSHAFTFVNVRYGAKQPAEVAVTSNALAPRTNLDKKIFNVHIDMHLAAQCIFQRTMQELVENGYLIDHGDDGGHTGDDDED